MREENVFGINVKVVNESDIAKEVETDPDRPRWYVCIRVKDWQPQMWTPALRSRITRSLCEKCRAICYVDPKSFDPFAGLNMVIVCSWCFARLAEDPNRGAAAESAWNEARGH